MSLSTPRDKGNLPLHLNARGEGTQARGNRQGTTGGKIAGPAKQKGEAGFPRFARFCFSGGPLFRVSATLLPVPFAGESGLNPLLFTWLQVKGMPLDLFDDVFGLHLALETAQRVLERLPFLQSDFSQ
jgi:hypothetical protein